MKKIIKYTISFLVLWFLIQSAIIITDGLNDEMGASDIGVILGTTVNVDGSLSDRLQKRLDKGIELYKHSAIKLIVVSGGLGKEGYYEGNKMSEYLIAKGVPKGKIIIDNSGNTTMATAKNVKKMHLKGESITVISQYFHITRTKLAFRNEGFVNVKGVHANHFEPLDFYSIFREFFGFYWYLLI